MRNHGKIARQACVTGHRRVLRLISFNLSLHHVGGPKKSLIRIRNLKYFQSFRDVLLHPIRELWSCLPVLLDRDLQIPICLLSVRRPNDHSNIPGHFFSLSHFWYIRLSVLLQMKLTSVPGNSRKASCAALLTWVEEISAPQSFSTISLTLRVDTPLMYISAIANFSARSLQIPFSIEEG